MACTFNPNTVPGLCVFATPALYYPQSPQRFIIILLRLLGILRVALLSQPIISTTLLRILSPRQPGDAHAHRHQEHNPEHSMRE